MSFGIRTKLFVASLLLIVLVGGSAAVYLEGELRALLVSRIEAQLLRQARTINEAMASSSVDAHRSIEHSDALADRMGKAAGVRVTLIDPQGRVLGDSKLSRAAVGSVENHGDRPEVKSAIAEGVGISMRYSTTLKTDMLYVATPASNARGVVRVALPLSEVDLIIGRLRGLLFFAGVFGLFAAIFMSALASHLLTSALRRLVDHSRAIARGGGSRIAISSSDELGRLAGSFNRIADELERTVAALAKERDRFEAVLQGMSEAVLALDESDRITVANPAAMVLLDQERSLIGEHLNDTIDVPQLKKLIEQLHASSSEFSLTNGRRVLATATPLRSGGVVVAMLDVTEMRRLETVRKDFVANVSHELRTPVSVIRANAETLLGGAMEDKKRSRTFLEALVRNSERVSSIIADLLDLSRIEAGKYAMDTGEIRIGSVLHRVLQSEQQHAQSKGITVQVAVPESTEAFADPKALDQVLFNLLENAVKYTSEGGMIQIRATEDWNKVRLEVQDNGPGIAPEHQKRIFERFYRVDPGRSRALGGTGLGLSIVKHLVEAMDGEVGVASAEPKGSIFWVELRKQRPHPT